MTGCAEAHCATQRQRMMDRIVRNMMVLSEHPHLSQPFRSAVGKLRCHWQLLLEGASAQGGDAPLRHLPPATLQ